MITPADVQALQLERDWRVFSGRTASHGPRRLGTWGPPRSEGTQSLWHVTPMSGGDEVCVMRAGPLRPSWHSTSLFALQWGRECPQDCTSRTEWGVGGGLGAHAGRRH